MRRIFGPGADRLIAAAITVSTFGFLDLTLLAPTRIYYAMGADGLFFRRLGRLHPRFQTPALAILLQAAWAIVLVLTGTYADLVDSVVFGDWIFFGLTVAAVFVFRRRSRPARPRVRSLPRRPATPGSGVLRVPASRRRRSAVSRPTRGVRSARSGTASCSPRGRPGLLLLRPAAGRPGPASLTMTVSRAPYMEWAKAGPGPEVDLAGSNLLACTLDDLPGAREALDLAGESPDGYPPLVEAIAAPLRRRAPTTSRRPAAAPARTSSPAPRSSRPATRS